MSSKKKRLEALRESREELVEKYNRIVLMLSGMQDQLADIDGDIRMLEIGQEERHT